MEGPAENVKDAANEKNVESGLDRVLGNVRLQACSIRIGSIVVHASRSLWNCRTLQQKWVVMTQV